jgi:hypothetical protein
MYLKTRMTYNLNGGSKIELHVKNKEDVKLVIIAITDSLFTSIFQHF